MKIGYTFFCRQFVLLLAIISLAGIERSVAQIPLTLRDTILQPGTSVGNYCIDDGWQHMDSALVLDDYFSDTIDIGFTFRFFGNDYTKCVLGGNVFLSFDLNQTGLFCPYQWSNTNTAFRNTIMPAFLDAHMFTSGSVKYQTQGRPGSRIFIAEWCGVPKYGLQCQGEKVTTQIVLHEGSNIIELNTLSLPGSAVCPSTNTNAKGIQGLVNSNNTVAVFTPGRGISDMWGNTGATNDAVRYIPSATSYTIDQSQPFRYKYIFTPQELSTIKWYKSGSNIVYATGPCLNITHDTAVDYYVARYDNYVNCNAVTLNFTDTIFVTSIPATVGLPALTEDNTAVFAYPNPVQDKVNLVAKDVLIRSVMMVDYMGKTVITASFNTNTAVLETRTVPKGLYLLIIDTDKGRALKRIIKQ